ncbi:MAG: hypothetical protein ACP5EP_10770 [Acidobacteriaceae bacterium]
MKQFNNVLCVRGDFHTKGNRCVEFVLDEENEDRLANKREFDLVASVLPEKLKRASPVWLVPVKNQSDLPPNFWGSPGRKRADGVFAVWIKPEKQPRIDATVDDMREYECSQALKKICTF